MTPRRPAARRGRPPVGGPTTLRLPTDLRARLDRARPAGESLADQVRRLLDVATDPELTPALEAGAAHLAALGRVGQARVIGELAARVNGARP